VTFTTPRPCCNYSLTIELKDIKPFIHDVRGPAFVEEQLHEFWEEIEFVLEDSR
jgi:hypothetical protein